ncbi:MAG TPA: biotin transporter BioY [Acidimicrobiales bacterium]|jgi:biotin transport system substrate-specific component|nr:biotin transporter BioY [Acidimicrobiales bacterium]
MTTATASTSPLAGRTTLADLLPRSRARTVALVVGFALLTAAAAQITIALPWTPVPLTGTTFAVLLAGATLGWRAGGASQVLYVGLGAVGLPFYQGGESGWTYATGATGGYLVGFVVAAALVGHLAERGQDRSLATSVPAMLAGTAVIYLFGVVWLGHVIGADAVTALEKGMLPFVIGDGLKLLAAGALLPLAWRLAPRRD